MSLQRLRRIVRSSLRVDIDSSQPTIDRVRRKVNARTVELQAKGKAPVPTKTPALVASLAGTPSIVIRPVDLLRKIGDLTTPSNVNMASLSASWATRRYFWAIAEPTGQNPTFRLSDDARAMDFHQKTLLSDEFGIGFGGLVLERLFDTAVAIDVSGALQNPDEFQNVEQSGSAQPDYLMWNPSANRPYYVVECKGCQTSRSATMDQIRRGLEQVPSLVFGAGTRQVITMVVASHMQDAKTTVYVVDPPNVPSDEDDPGDKESTTERIGKNTWRINNPEEFGRIAESKKQAKLLNWAGQFTSASRLISRARRRDPANDAGPDLQLIRRQINDVNYYGRRMPFFPELGYPRLRIFAGVQEEVLESARRRAADVGQPEGHALVTRPPREAEIEDPKVSVGKDGTCLILDGI
jgi:hypothetical protein